MRHFRDGATLHPVDVDPLVDVLKRGRNGDGVPVLVDGHYLVDRETAIEAADRFMDGEVGAAVDTLGKAVVRAYRG